MRIWIACLVTLLWALPQAAYAEGTVDFAQAAELLASEEAEAIRQGIAQVAQSGDARALPVLSALKQGALHVQNETRQLFIVEGGVAHRVADNTVQPCEGCRQVIVNNAIRRALTANLAQLELTSADVKLRKAAAEALAQAPSVELRSLLEGAARTETDSEVRGLIQSTLLQIDLDSSDVSRRKAAVIALGETGDLAFKPRVERLLEKDGDGNFLEADATVRAAALGVLSKLRWVETRTRIVGDVLYGLSLGSILLLAALGLAITFGLMGVINMAHGEMLMLGAYVTYVVQLGFQRYAPEFFEWYVACAVPLAFVVCALIGVGIERTVLRFLYGRPLETLLATWGVSLALIQTVRLIFGAQNVAVAGPSWLSGGYPLMQGIVLPYNRLAIVVFGALVLGFVWLILTRSRLGLDVRAVTQNRAMAACMGIRTHRVDMWTFGIGSGVAGLGGVALSQVGNVGPELGQNYIVDSFMVVVLGGVGKLAGTVVGAFGLGIINKLLEPVSGAVLGKILVLALIILFIQKRPQGIFALKGRMAEG